MEVENNATSLSSFRQKFESKLKEYELQHKGSIRNQWTTERVLEVINNIRQARINRTSNQLKKAVEYYWISKYDIKVISNKEFLIFKKKSSKDPTVRIIPRNKYFNILHKIHEACGHGGLCKMTHSLKSKFYIPKKAIGIFLAYCPICKTTRHSPNKTKVIPQPIATLGFNNRGQLDLIDLQSCPDGEYKWLLHYQDNATKYINLRPLKTKTAQEVATELLKIFLSFGAPCILQANCGRKFTENISKHLAVMLPKCKIVNGNSMRPQVERCNQNIENMLRSWMSNHKSTNWCLGCYHVQYEKNAALNPDNTKTPYQALFGIDPKAGLSGLTTTFLNDDKIDSKEHLPYILKQESSTKNKQVDNPMYAIEPKTILCLQKIKNENVNRNIDVTETESNQIPKIKSEY